MHRFVKDMVAVAAVIGLLLFLATSSPLMAQVPGLEDRPRPWKGRPATRAELNQRESLHQYAFGLLCEREDRLLEALKAYEEAGRLDPEAQPVFRAQAQILLAVDRGRDAQAALRKALVLDPGDYEAWLLAGRVHKTFAEYADARKCFTRGLEAGSLVDHPAMALQFHLELGQLHETMEELPEAVIALGAAAKILDQPDLLMEHGRFDRNAIMAKSAQTHERMGALCRRLKRFDQALGEYKKAQTLRPDGAGRLNLHLAQLCVEQAKLDQALPFLDAYLRLQPLGLEAYEMKIDVLRRLGKTEAVVPWLEQATRADPNNPRLKVMLAQQYAHSRQFASAEKLFKGLADESPSPEVYKGLFQLYADKPGAEMLTVLNLLDKTVAKAKEKGPPGLAAQQARAMIAALEDNGALMKDLVRVGMQEINRQRQDLQFDTLHLLAVLSDRHKKLDEAEQFYRAILKKPNPNTEALVYGGLLRVLWKGRKYEEILDVCKQGLGEVKGVPMAQATNYILFYNDRAKALAALGRMDEALKAADRAVDLAGDNDRLTLRRLKVRLLTDAEKYDAAEAECQDMFKEFRQAGDTLEVRYLLSHVYSARRDHDKAEQQLQMILKVDPDNATVNNDLGYQWADRSKNLAEAEAMIRRALDLDRRQRKLGRPGADGEADNAAYVDSLGWVLFRRGRLDEARQELERAVKLDGGEDATIFDHLGDVLVRLDRPGDARAAWEKALHLYQKEKGRKMNQRQQEVERKLKALP